MTDDDGLNLTRRELGAAAAGVAGAAGLGLFGYRRLTRDDVDDVLNVFEEYPNQDWEEHYRDVWEPDDSYTITCTPNDTHNCYLEASVKNGEVTRIGPSMNYGEATDLDGNQASKRWDPRICNKGIAMVERFYSDRRVKEPMVREGFREWVEDGFPREDDGSMPEEYARRGEDDFVAVDFDEAFELAARAQLEIAEYYSGEDGMQALLEQGYDERMVEETQGAGVRTMNYRGGMPLLGMIKLFGLYRFANSMALVDHHVRGVSEDDALGGAVLDNYSFHTDLPPGHPMVTGQQTVDFDLANVEYADHVVLCGINWLATKMADCHWLTEARLKGTKVTGIFTDYNSTASKCDELITLRPGTDSALFLGAARIIMEDGLYDEEFVRQNTDLPLLVRMDEGTFLRASDVFEGYEPADLEWTDVVDDEGDLAAPFATDQGEQVVTEEMRREWGDFVVRNEETDEFEAITREDVNDEFTVPAALEGGWEIELATGETVEVRPVFDLILEHLTDTWDLETTAEVTGTTTEAVENLAHDIADNREQTLIATGMGPNHYTNQDQKDRTAYLLASLSANIGRFGGNIGSYAGNYRAAYFNGVPQWHAENPFDIELDPEEPATPDPRWDFQSAHFYAHLDQPLRVEGQYFMGDSHMPTPTKSFWVAGSNSILGNAKGAYKIIQRMLRNGNIEAFFTNEWWWTMTCEYSDIVFPVDSWAEHHVHDVTASVTNPFVMAMPETKIDRIYDTRNDAQIYKGVAEKLAELLDEPRFEDYWAFIDEDEYQAKPYIQRILDHSNMMKGYDIEELLDDAEDGTPALIMGRSYPKFVGSRHTEDGVPWYTKTGRLEFFREEDMFAQAGENIPLHREPIDATPYEPNVIVDDGDHPIIDPDTPDDLGWDDDRVEDPEARQVRNVVRSSDELVGSNHPLSDRDEGYEYVYMTPKYRHGAHTFANSLPNIAVWWGPFGDMHREDERKPFYGEGYVEMNPADAQAEGFEDGDYVWVDGDPADRPYPGWDEDDDDYEVARALMRVRYQPAMPEGITRSWFNLNQATHGTVEATPDREGLAKNEGTDYVSLYRRGGHQSMTRSWFRQTRLTDDMPRKDLLGQNIGQGFAPDVHCANGAPSESFVKFEKEGDAGEDGTGDWRPAELGLRPGYEDDRMEQYLSGEFTTESD